jgi:Domain of unknown function (DUF1995)
MLRSRAQFLPVSILAFLWIWPSVQSFVTPCGRSFRSAQTSTAQWAMQKKCTPLPPGLSPFEKTVAKSLDIQGSFRKIAAAAVDRAISDGLLLLEIDFPPFVGGDQSKSQFDDYDNLQELNANRDWCVQLVPLLKKCYNTWLVLPDDKECELAANEWTGQLFRKNTKFTSIRAACEATRGSFKKAWGSTLAENVSKLQGGDGILADSSTLDALDASESRLQLVCQPGNGGPVEDWINVEQLHRSSKSPTCVVNGALDKVRDGYYPAIFFPALAKTVPFYKQFEPIFIAKPISDKGVYGWLYRVYPEPWQVILQTARQTTNGSQTTIKVDETVAMVSDTRPTYVVAVNALVQEAARLA